MPVSEAAMAIALAQHGGIGVIHKNFGIEDQAAQVRQVKKFESGMVVNPVTIHPDQTLAEARALMTAHRISGIPVVERDTSRLVGILTNRDVRIRDRPVGGKVYELMTRENLITVNLWTLGPWKRRAGCCIATGSRNWWWWTTPIAVSDWITVKDMDKVEGHPLANKDELGRLRVAAATGVGDDGHARAVALIAAGRRRW